MTIALTASRRFDGARYQLAGQISRNANWVQSLDIPADGNSVSVTGSTLALTFRKSGSVIVTVVPTVSDADTIAISATASALGALSPDQYDVDLTGTLAGVVTHWAHGQVMVLDNPAS